MPKNILILNAGGTERLIKLHVRNQATKKKYKSVFRAQRELSDGEDRFRSVRVPYLK